MPLPSTILRVQRADRLHGTVKAPPSKSYTHRAVIVASMNGRTEVVNPLKPYYLVYVRADGVVRFTFAQPKQILEIYRILCSGKPTPYEELCTLFDEETSCGTDMDRYDELLQAAVRAIASTFRKRTASHLQSGRGAVLIEQREQARETTDFELVTWLVIR